MNSSTDAFTIRFARAADIPQILAFIRQLAEYERLAHEAIAEEDDLMAALFGPHAVAEVLLAELPEGEPCGFALFFKTFSTFLGKPGIYLEDLFVTPPARGKGVGTALLRALAKLVIERGYGRLEWAVLNWNTPAIRVYERIGAEPLSGWTVNRLTGQALHTLAE
jgi:GNAT superfamily N-acetyltransferase